MNIMELAPVEIEIIRERLRQAKISFNIAQASSIVFTSFSLVGAIMLMCGNITEGTAITSISMVSSVGCIRLAKDANDRLDRLIDESRPKEQTLGTLLSPRYGSDVSIANDSQPPDIALAG